MFKKVDAPVGVLSEPEENTSLGKISMLVAIVTVFSSEGWPPEARLFLLPADGGQFSCEI